MNDLSTKYEIELNVYEKFKTMNRKGARKREKINKYLLLEIVVDFYDVWLSLDLKFNATGENLLPRVLCIRAMR